jgi:hypothetical protein
MEKRETTKEVEGGKGHGGPPKLGSGVLPISPGRP